MTVQWCFTHNRLALRALNDQLMCQRVKRIEGDCLDVAEMVPVRADTELYEWVGSDDSMSEGSPILALIATKVLRRVGVPHEHEWVDARNEIVLSGEVCIGCKAVRRVGGDE